MSSSQSTDTLMLPTVKYEDDPRFEILYKRNAYLEKEFAKAMRLLNEEKENCAAKIRDLQTLTELKAKLESLQNKYTKVTERVNEYHALMQQAKAETIGLKRKINGVIGHIQGAIILDAIPGAAVKEVRNAYERIYDENKLLKWKLNVAEGYLTGMFSEDEDDAG